MELLEYKWGLTKIFIDRVFETSQTFDQLMDYKGFVDFLLAFENIKEKAACRYFFKIVDVYNKGAIDSFVINMFLREIVKKLTQ